MENLFRRISSSETIGDRSASGTRFISATKNVHRVSFSRCPVRTAYPEEPASPGTFALDENTPTPGRSSGFVPVVVLTGRRHTKSKQNNSISVPVECPDIFTDRN